MGLTERLGSGPLAVDTVAFIYFIEEHPDFLSLIAPIFQEADAGWRQLVTSAVTLLEVLVVPYREGNIPLADRYEALLTRSRGVEFVEIDRLQLRTAAQLKGLHRLRTPDALQVAAAISRNCKALVTNDRALPSIHGLRIIQLRDYLANQ